MKAVGGKPLLVVAVGPRLVAVSHPGWRLGRFPGLALVASVRSKPSPVRNRLVGIKPSPVHARFAPSRPRVRSSGTKNLSCLVRYPFAGSPSPPKPSGPAGRSRWSSRRRFCLPAPTAPKLPVLPTRMADRLALVAYQPSNPASHVLRPAPDQHFRGRFRPGDLAIAG